MATKELSFNSYVRIHHFLQTGISPQEAFKAIVDHQTNAQLRGTIPSIEIKDGGIVVYDPDYAKPFLKPHIGSELLH